jgi:hypothetical protein
MDLTTVQQQIYKLLEGQPLRFFTPAEVSHIVGTTKYLQRDTEWSFQGLKHLADIKLIEMTATGHFRYFEPETSTQNRIARGRPTKRLHASPQIGSILRQSGIGYDGQTIEIPDTKQTLKEGLAALQERLAARQTNRKSNKS